MFHKKGLAAAAWIVIVQGHGLVHAQSIGNAPQAKAAAPVRPDQPKIYSEVANYEQDGGKIYLNGKDYILFNGAFNYFGYAGNSDGGKSLKIELRAPLQEQSYRNVECSFSAGTLPPTAKIKTAKGLFQNYLESYSPENRAKNPLNSYSIIEPSERSGLYTIKSKGQRGPTKTLRYNQFFERDGKVWNISYFCLAKTQLELDVLVQSRISLQILL